VPNGCTSRRQVFECQVFWFKDKFVLPTTNNSTSRNEFAYFSKQIYVLLRMSPHMTGLFCSFSLLSSQSICEILWEDFFGPFVLPVVIACTSINHFLYFPRELFLMIASFPKLINVYFPSLTCVLPGRWSMVQLGIFYFPMEIFSFSFIIFLISQGIVKFSEFYPVHISIVILPVVTACTS
jgi:hypothetical protein